MNRKRIVLEPVSLDYRNVLEELHGYRPTINTTQLSGAILESPEYGSWRDLLEDVRGDVAGPIGSEVSFQDYESNKVSLLWVPGFESLQDGEVRFKSGRGRLDALFYALLEAAEKHGDMMIQYGPAGPVAAHDRLTFRRDGKSVIYCVRASILGRHIINYRYTEPFPIQNKGTQIYAYYHEAR